VAEDFSVSSSCFVKTIAAGNVCVVEPMV